MQDPTSRRSFLSSLFAIPVAALFGRLAPERFTRIKVRGKQTADSFSVAVKEYIESIPPNTTFHHPVIVALEDGWKEVRFTATRAIPGQEPIAETAVGYFRIS